MAFNELWRLQWKKTEGVGVNVELSFTLFDKIGKTPKSLQVYILKPKYGDRQPLHTP